MSRIQHRTATLLRFLAESLERRPAIAVILLVVLYLPAALDASRMKPMWHDELFTYYIAQAPTVRELLRQTQTLDLNPPLTYLLTRWSLHVVGVSTLATRLPEIAGFLLALLALFRFVHRRMGTCFALFAGALLLENKVLFLAVEARPYALLLGFGSLALATWQSAVDGEGINPRGQPAKVWLAMGVLSLCMAGMLLSHVLALLPVCVFAMAEGVRWRRTRTHPFVLPAILLPVVVTAWYGPLLRNHGSGLYPPALQPDGDTIFEFYIGSVDRQLVTLCLAALAVLVLMGGRHLRTGGRREPPSWFFTVPEWTATAGLMLVALVVLLQFMHSHAAFFERYGAVEALGVTLLACALLGRWTMDHESGRPDPRAGLLGSLVAVLISGAPMVIPGQIRSHTLIPTLVNSEPRQLPCQACTAAPSLPLVDASGLTFLQMSHYEPASTLDRLYYLTDEEASTRVAHANIFEQMPLLVEAFHLKSHAVSYRDFLATHPRFLVLGRYDYPEDWLLRQLQADGATLRVLGRTNDSYRDTELYEVTLAADRSINP